MKTAKILQATSILAALQYTAHAVLFLSATPTHGPDEIAVIETMKAHRFDVYGFDRSYWDFYFGYGLLAILFGLVEVVVLWQLATLAKADSYRVRPIIGMLIFANVAHALLMWRYFFLGPLLFDVAVAACLGWAFLAARADEHASVVAAA